MSRVLVTTALAVVFVSYVSTQSPSSSAPTVSPWLQVVDECEVWKNWTQTEICDFVNVNYDSCEGGGYLIWSKYVECTDNTASKIVVLIVGILFLLFLFYSISMAADEFFSPNVAAIVVHLKISESVAGVTFLAFGNGTSDVFSSIASVVSSPTPKANLALGELLGGNVFVTLMVTATIILTSPFQLDAFATTRDLVFLLISAGFLLFFFLHSTTLSIWEPIVFLGIYVIYVGTVILGEKMKTKMKKERRATSVAPSRAISRNSVVPSINIISDAVQRITDEEEENGIISHSSSVKSHSNISNHLSMSHRLSIFPPLDLVAAFGQEDEDDDDDDEVVVIHGHVYKGEEARSRAASIVPPPIQNDTWKVIFEDLYEHLRPLPTMEEFKEMNYFDKVMVFVKMVPLFVFKATIPLYGDSWSKAVGILHAGLCSITFLFCIKLLTVQLPYGGPGLWLYGLGLSVILMVFVLIFTKTTVQPKYYKEFYSYLGFLMAIVWIYTISSEVVNVVAMIGLVSRVPHEILGMTILAWSNSINDLIADVSVVKQGYPRMAMAAAIGGPLFNLLIGFGLPFTIALAQGKTVSITFKTDYHMLLLFLFISITVQLIGIFAQKFYVRRPYAFILIFIYATFIVMVILSQTKIIVWGNN